MNQDIQKLRGIAILLVLYNHLSPTLLPTGSRAAAWWDKSQTVITGWAGVDLFFVISGFVISSVLIEQLDRHQSPAGRRREIVAFWLKRFYRLFPSAMLWLLITLAGAFLFNRSGAFGTPRDVINDICAYLAQVRNIAYAYGVSGQPISLYWSLSLEDQFYIGFPILLALLPANRSRIRFFAALAAVQFFLRRPQWSSLGWQMRTDAFAFGVLLYYFYQTETWRNIRPVFLENRLKRGLFTLAMIFLILAVPRSLQAVPVSVGLVGMICGVWVWAASYDQNYILPFGQRIISWIGDRSFSIYMVHSFSAYLSREIWFRMAGDTWLLQNDYYTAAMVLTAASFAVFFGELNFRLIEVPLRRKGRDVAAAFASRAADSPLQEASHRSHKETAVTA